MLRFATAVAAALVLSACGQGQAPAGDAPQVKQGDAPADLQAPPLSSAEAPQPVSVGPAAPPAREPGVYRNGNFSIHVEQATLAHTRDTSNRVHLRANLTLTFHNAGAEPMSVILVDYQRNLNILLDNGMRLGASLNANPGLGNCRRDVATCLAASSGDYIHIPPGDTASVNISLGNMYGGDNPSLGAIPSVETGNLAGRLHVVEGAAGRELQASLLNTPLQNNVRL